MAARRGAADIEKNFGTNARRLTCSLFDRRAAMGNLKDVLFPIRPADPVHATARSLKLTSPSGHCLAESHGRECVLVRRAMQTLDALLAEHM